MGARKRVLIIRVGMLGDTVMALGVVEQLTQRFGDNLSIDWVAKSGAPARLLQLEKRINRVFPVQSRRRPWWFDESKRQLRRESSANPYDIAINLETGSGCDGIARLVGAVEKYGRPWTQSPEPSGHAVEVMCSVAGDLLQTGDNKIAEPRFVSGENMCPAPVFDDPGFVVVNPGYSHILDSGYKQHRGWPIPHWRALIEDLLANNIKPVVNGAPQEAPALQDLLGVSGIHSIVGCDLGELIGTLRRAQAVVSVDTGIAHLAAAVGTPTVTLFGPTDAGVTGPFSLTGRTQAVRHPVPCSPCFGESWQKACRFNRCMSELQPGQVSSALFSMLASVRQ